MSTQRASLCIAALTSLTWGLTGVFVRLLPPLPSLSVTTARLVIASAAGFPVLLFSRDIRAAFVQATLQPWAIILALVLAAYYFLATTAFQMAPVAEVALLLSTPPLFVLLFRRVSGQIPTKAEISGAFLAICGIGVIMTPRISFGQELSAAHLYGNIIAACAAAMTAIYAFLYQRLATRNKAPQTVGVSLLTFLIGGMVCVALLWASAIKTRFADLDQRSILILLALGVISTAIPTLGFAVASRRLPALITSLIPLFIPVFSGIFAFLILHESLSAVFLGGSALVLGGVGMILFRK